MSTQPNISEKLTITAFLSEDAGPDVIWEPHPAFVYLETICVVWFTIEYVLRFAVAPNRCQFIFGLLNIVDLIAILPFYLEIFLGMFGFDVASLSDIKGRLRVQCLQADFIGPRARDSVRKSSSGCKHVVSLWALA